MTCLPNLVCRIGTAIACACRAFCRLPFDNLSALKHVIRIIIIIIIIIIIMIIIIIIGSAVWHHPKSKGLHSFFIYKKMNFVVEFQPNSFVTTCTRNC